MKKISKEIIDFQRLFALGLDHQKKKNFKEATDYYKKAIQKAEHSLKFHQDVDPSYSCAYNNLGNVFINLKKKKDAVDCYFKAIKINPKFAAAYYNLGNVFKGMEKHQEAVDLFKKAIEIDPNFALAQNNLGTTLNNMGKGNEAISYFKKAIQNNPNFIEAYNNLGNAMKVSGKPNEAINFFEKAIQINPKYTLAYNNLGNTYRHLLQQEKAISCYQKAINIRPNFLTAHTNLASVYRELGKHQLALDCYAHALNIDPNSPQANNNFGMLLLMLSDFDKGFEYYEWRKKILTHQDYSEYLKLNLTSKVWNGEDLNNKTILILSEQGFGDIFEFARYLFILKRKYETKVIFRARKKLVHLFKKNEFEVISETDPLPQHDYHCFLLSLPKIFFEKEKKLAKRINYINVDEKIILKWKDKLSSIKGYKVGINWQGDPKSDLSRLRSTPLSLFETFFSIENLNFISLQKGSGAEQIQNFKYRDRLYDFMSDADNKNAFEDTIGILKNLDLVITSDTSLAHVSSTLGVKTWVVLPLSPHWTWFLNSDRSPWYENTKLYRQKDFNRWDSVFTTVKKDLINEYNIQK